MTVLVGYGPEARGRGGLQLAAMLARSAPEPLVVCCVAADRWEVPGVARVDVEYADRLKKLAWDALGRAREILGEHPDVEFVVRTGRSVPATLVDEAAARDARILVLGSSSHGSWGHIALGSVSERLLHSAQVPIALAPRGFRAAAGTVVRRATVALNGRRSSEDVLLAAAQVTHEVAAKLRVVTFAVRGRTMYPPAPDLHPEDAVMQAWRAQASEFLARAVKRVAGQGGVIAPEDVGIVDGRGWGEALENVEWDDGDVLVIGSGSQGILSRVFLGSTAARILRNAPVPVIVLPLEVAAQVP